MPEQVPPGSYPDKEGPADWSIFTQIIFHERKTILLITGIAFIASTVFFSLIPNTYEAEVQILVEQLGNLEKISPADMTQNFRGEDDYYGTQVAMIMGRKVAERLAADLKIPGGSYQLFAKRVRGTRLISVLVKSKNRTLAAQVANRAVDIYIQEKAQDDLFVAKQMLKWLPGQSPNIVSSSEEPGAERKETPEFTLPSEADDVTAQKLRETKLAIETKIAEMSVRYKPEYPALKELHDRLVNIDEQIQQRKDVLVNSFKAGVMGDFHLTNIKVLSPAPVPKHHSSPKRTKGILGVTMIGFVCGVLMALYVEQVNPRVWYEDEVRAAINVPFMGYIPLISGLTTKEEKKRMSEASISKVARLQNLLKSSKDNPMLADAVTLMRTHLFFSVPTQKSKALMMTSTTPNEGKSTVIALFALSLASMGKKIVVIDADLRRPYINVHLGIKNEVGLTDYLAGEAEITDIVKSIPDSTLKVITGGVLKTSASHLLSSSTRFKALLDAITADYDYVLIDAPPVLYIPDGLIIAEHVQGVVLITSAGMIRRQVLQAVKSKFDEVKRPIIGAVINRADHALDLKYRRYFKQYKNYYYSVSSGQKVY